MTTLTFMRIFCVRKHVYRLNLFTLEKCYKVLCPSDGRARYCTLSNSPEPLESFNMKLGADVKDEWRQRSGEFQPDNSHHHWLVLFQTGSQENTRRKQVFSAVSSFGTSSVSEPWETSTHTMKPRRLYFTLTQRKCISCSCCGFESQFKMGKCKETRVHVWKMHPKRLRWDLKDKKRTGWCHSLCVMSSIWQNTWFWKRIHEQTFNMEN